MARAPVHLDAGIFVDATETAGASRDRARWLVAAATAGEIAPTANALAAAEVVSRPSRVGDVAGASYLATARAWGVPRVGRARDVPVPDGDVVGRGGRPHMLDRIRKECP